VQPRGVRSAEGSKSTLFEGVDIVLETLMLRHCWRCTHSPRSGRGYATIGGSEGHGETLTRI